MAGHSKFKNIMYRKGAQDKKRAALFSKLGREITVAAKMGGGDPETNARLRLAVSTARAQSMPKDNIERAIKKGAGGLEDVTYESLRYEGYGPSGVAVIVDILTDNKNRSAADIRSIFNRYGGNMGETNSVAYNFDRLGEILYPISIADADTVFEAGLEAGALDIISEDDSHDIFCESDDLHKLVRALEGQFGDPVSAKLTWRPKVMTSLAEDKVPSFLKFIDALDDHDDVQNVAYNVILSDDMFAQFEDS